MTDINQYNYTNALRRVQFAEQAKQKAELRLVEAKKAAAHMAIALLEREQRRRSGLSETQRLLSKRQAHEEKIMNFLRACDCQEEFNVLVSRMLPDDQ